MADETEDGLGGWDVVRVPFCFVPHGAPEPTDWMAPLLTMRHLGARFPMKSCQKILLLLLSYCLIPLAFAREPLKHPSIPPKLQGLWAKGGHCDDPKRQLRVTAHTTQFGTKKPVRSYYFPNDDVIQYAAIVQDVNDPRSTLADSALTYERFQDFFDYGRDTDKGQIYFRCPAQKPSR